MADVEFERLVEEFYVPLYRFGLSLRRNEADASDLASKRSAAAWIDGDYAYLVTGKAVAKRSRNISAHRDFLRRKNQRTK